MALVAIVDKKPETEGFTMTTLFATKAQAQAVLNRRAGKKRNPQAHFSVSVMFGEGVSRGDGGGDPQVIAENVKGAACAIDAARTWAMGAVRRGTCELSDVHNVFGIRPIDNAKAPSEEERMLRRMLNGGGLRLTLGDVVFEGTFTGYSVPR